MAFAAPTDATFTSLNAPRYDSVGAILASPETHTQFVNSAWTHPNPYVEQVGNHLFYKKRDSAFPPIQ